MFFFRKNFVYFVVAAMGSLPALAAVDLQDQIVKVNLPKVKVSKKIDSSVHMGMANLGVTRGISNQAGIDENRQFKNLNLVYLGFNGPLKRWLPLDSEFWKLGVVAGMGIDKSDLQSNTGVAHIVNRAFSVHVFLNTELVRRSSLTVNHGVYLNGNFLALSAKDSRMDESELTKGIGYGVGLEGDIAENFSVEAGLLWQAHSWAKSVEYAPFRGYAGAGYRW